MSYNFRNIREQSNSPLEKEVNDLAKIQAAGIAKAQLALLDEKEDIFPSGVDDDIAVKLHDELHGIDQLLFDTVYQPTFEPDHDHVTLMLPGRSLGERLRDFSGFGNHGIISGEPLLVDGAPFDPGIFDHGMKSVATRFNRPTSPYVNEEYITVPDNPTLRVNALTTGFSIFFRFRIFDLAQQGGLRRTGYEKTDDNDADDGYLFKIDTDGKIVFVLAQGGSETKKQTPASLVVPGLNNINEVWITYDMADLKIYHNEVLQTLSNNVDSAGWHGTNSNHDLSIFRRGAGSSGGYTYGDFYDMRIFQDYVVSQTEVSNHFENKFTIWDRALGTCMITNHWTLLSALLVYSSYTSASYTSASYNT